MDDNATETREETIAALNAALAELEGGEGLSRFVGGHGIFGCRMRVFSRTRRSSRPTMPKSARRSAWRYCC